MQAVRVKVNREALQQKGVIVITNSSSFCESLIPQLLLTLTSANGPRSTDIDLHNRAILFPCYDRDPCPENDRLSYWTIEFYRCRRIWNGQSPIKAKERNALEHWSLGKVPPPWSPSEGGKIVKAQNHSKGHSFRRGENVALISDEVFWFRFFDDPKKWK